MEYYGLTLRRLTGTDGQNRQREKGWLVMITGNNYGTNLNNWTFGRKIFIRIDGRKIYSGTFFAATAEEAVQMAVDYIEEKKNA